jgi:6-pyruvoyltetrahydropterin/6-carboxytetrahydropterin synthase
VAVPVITRACDQRPEVEPGSLLPEILLALGKELPRLLLAVRWWLSPYYSVEMSSESPQVVLLRQRFDFAASHRLHNPALSDQENQVLFGKCNNPSGHGHNYQFEPTVAIALQREGRQGFSLQDLERLAEDVILRRFDHKNLSSDTPEFAPGTGLNPSVEQIARVFYELLAPAVSRASPDAHLKSLTVWETDRTSSTYPGL